MTERTFLVLVATDGSDPARTAVEAAARFCWPEPSAAVALVVRHVPIAPNWPAAAWEALAERDEAEGRRAAQRLRRRWKDAESTVVVGRPVDAIVREARRRRAGALVLGSRGLGPIRQLVLGSVGRGVIQQAPCPVLLVRGPARAARRLLVGVDGSANARRAVDLVARFTPPRGGTVHVVSVVEPFRLPSAGLMPASVRGALTAEAAEVNRERLAAADRHVLAARRVLERAGWRVEGETRQGRPLDELLRAAARADVAVVGARGVGGVERLLLGSVAHGVVNHAAGSVLVVP